MGNRESSEKLKQKDVKGLVTMTKFSKTELKDWHKDFLKVSEMYWNWFRTDSVSNPVHNACSQMQRRTVLTELNPAGHCAKKGITPNCEKLLLTLWNTSRCFPEATWPKPSSDRCTENSFRTVTMRRYFVLSRKRCSTHCHSVHFQAVYLLVKVSSPQQKCFSVRTEWENNLLQYFLQWFFQFANNVFQTFDKNQDNKMDFCEFMTALHFLTTTADPRQRLMWAFELYDTHNSDQTQLMISESRDYIKPPRFTKIFSWQCGVVQESWIGWCKIQRKCMTETKCIYEWTRKKEFGIGPHWKTVSSRCRTSHWDSLVSCSDERIFVHILAPRW